MPVYGTGAMAGIPITDTQGFGIPTDAKDPASAAALLEYMHSQERVNAMWTESRALPADEKFDASLIDDAVPEVGLRDMVGRASTTSTSPT